MYYLCKKSVNSSFDIINYKFNNSIIFADGGRNIGIARL